MIKRLAERELDTKYGRFTQILYYEGLRESIALVRGEVSNDDVLCRVHSACISGHVFNGIECKCAEEMTHRTLYLRPVLNWPGPGAAPLAMMCALPGSQSQKNAQKNGFDIAYTRTKWHLAG